MGLQPVFDGLNVADTHPFPIRELHGVATAELVQGSDGEPAIDWNDTIGEFLRTRGGQKRPRHALGRFLALANASDAQVLSFVRAFDALRFADTGGIHIPQLRRSAGVIELWSLEEGLKRPTPTAWYRAAAMYFRAIYRLAVSADRGEGGSEEDWEILGRLTWMSKKPKPRDAWSRVTLSLQSLVDSCGVKLTLGDDPTWLIPIPGGRRPRIMLSGHGLWGVLAVQLAYAVTGGESQAVCSVCGEIYPPSRRPQAGRRMYCPKHGKASDWREAKRLAQQARRAKLRS